MTSTVIVRRPPMSSRVGAAASSPPSSAAAAAPPPPPEDQAGDGGTAIDTFASYRPTSLPPRLLHLLNGESDTPPVLVSKVKSEPVESTPKTPGTKSTTPAAISPSTPEVIDLLDDDNDNDDNDDDDNDIDRTSASTNKPIHQSSHVPPATLSAPTLQVASHTSLACESALLASVRAPPIPQDDSTLATVLDLAKTQALSPLQLESVLLATQRHRRILRGGLRAGFFVGDGAGVGKGRQIAAILKDSFCRQGHARRHVWLSVSRELVQDARRDLTGVGLHCEVYDGTQVLDQGAARGLGGSCTKGVLFGTYQLLVSNKRLEQIVSWCAGTGPTVKKALYPQLEAEYNGCIVLDEAHKAKNLKDDSRTAKLVIELQRRLPKARVVYCSATGVSDVGHMVYAERLGLWQTPQTFGSLFSSFADFQRALEQRGLGSLELLALELKQQGSFMARTLSWDGAEFETLQIPLDTHQRQVYDQVVRWWAQLKQSLETILQLPIMQAFPPNSTNNLWRIFWSAHQRCFKELAICAKIPTLAKDAQRHVAQGDCVIFGLQTTGDAGLQSLLSSGDGDGGGRFSSLPSTVAATLKSFLQLHFPVAPGKPQPPRLPDQPPPPTASLQERQQYQWLLQETQRIAQLPPPAPIPELVACRQDLCDRMDAIPLPPNPLDDLMDRLGGPDQVSELTGRLGRMLRVAKRRSQQGETDGGDARFEYTKRGGSTADETNGGDRINLVEKRLFMDGTKSYAIISDAASTGISLHSAKGSKGSHKRRIHYTIELPWSADKAVQQLGRSHRSAQESAPRYKLVVTDLGGERRFAAAVSKRMASLGALTKGDRRAATGSDLLSDFDLDSRYGKKALKRLYGCLNVICSNVLQIGGGGNGEGPTSQNTVLPSRRSAEVMDQWYQERVAAKDDLRIQVVPPTGPSKYPAILRLVCRDLESVGLDQGGRTQQGEVKVFLNRIFGLQVAMQNLIFSLFLSTVDDLVGHAKLNGEFDGSAEDIKATSIEIAEERVLAHDPSCGAETRLTTLLLDRGISLERVCDMAKEVGRLQKKSTEAETVHEDEDTKATGDQTSLQANARDAWHSKDAPVRNLAQSGFYISKNRIAGRHLVLFAKCRFPTYSFKTDGEAAGFDPLGLMVITRPNTGTNPCEMTTRDLETKYRLALGCDKFLELLQAEDAEAATNTDTSVGDSDCEVVESASAVASFESTPVARLWNSAFTESNYDVHSNGLAPRLANVALVTGAVLHVLPILEQVVSLRSASDRALKIMRVEIGTSTESTRRLVGVRFPTDEDALQKLEIEMEKLRVAQSTIGDSFVDEPLAPLCQKSRDWATFERKTMKSFFKVATKDASSVTQKTKDRVPGPSRVTPKLSTVGTKRAAGGTQHTKNSSAGYSNKKTKNIASFFFKKGG